MRILVTGASGYLGRYAVPVLCAMGHEVHTVTRHRHSQTKTTTHIGNLLDRDVPEAIIAAVQPEAVLHLAWEATPGTYWNSPDNDAWARATMALAHAASESGVGRFVGVGSCAEYDWGEGHCEEGVTALRPTSKYGQAKLAAFHAVTTGNRPGFSTAWCRVFFVFGGSEHPGRLVPSVGLAIRRGEPAVCSHGQQVRDFMHVTDVGHALATVLLATITGPVNIASGSAHRVRDVVEGLAARLGRPDLVRVSEKFTDYPILTASTYRLRNEVGWTAALDFEAALDAVAREWGAK